MKYESLVEIQSPRTNTIKKLVGYIVPNGSDSQFALTRPIGMIQTTFFLYRRSRMYFPMQTPQTPCWGNFPAHSHPSVHFNISAGIYDRYLFEMDHLRCPPPPSTCVLYESPQRRRTTVLSAHRATARPRSAISRRRIRSRRRVYSTRSVPRYVSQPTPNSSSNHRLPSR